MGIAIHAKLSNREISHSVSFDPRKKCHAIKCFARHTKLLLILRVQKNAILSHKFKDLYLKPKWFLLVREFLWSHIKNADKMVFIWHYDLGHMYLKKIVKCSVFVRLFFFLISKIFFHLLQNKTSNVKSEYPVWKESIKVLVTREKTDLQSNVMKTPFFRTNRSRDMLIWVRFKTAWNKFSILAKVFHSFWFFSSNIN